MMIHPSAGGSGVELGEGSLAHHPGSATDSATPSTNPGSSGGEGNTLDAAFSYDKVFPALGKPSAKNKPVLHPTAIDKMRIGSSTVTQVFVISRDERKVDNNVFGNEENFNECKIISTATNTKIEVSSNRNQALTFVVSGKQADVFDAKKRIIAHFQTPSSGIIKIPKEYHGSILGKGRNNLKDLEKQTECKIAVPPMNEPSDTITVSGPRDGVEKALHELRLIWIEKSKQHSEKVTVPKIYHPFICGAYNETVNRIMEQFNVKIHMPPPASQSDEISIVGEKEGAKAAKERIEAIHQQVAKYGSVSVEVPKAQHKYIKGPKRSTIAEILQATNVSVEIPPLDNPTDTITLRGPQDKMGEALNMVYAKASSMQSATLNAPEWLHKRLKGKKGANIRRYMEGTSLHIEFKDDTIRIEGPPEEVDATKIALQQEINDYVKNLVFEELEVDQKYYKHIIGKSGANVNRMKEEIGVDMDLIKEGPGSGTVRLEGTRDAVVRAKREIQEMVDKLRSEKERVLKVEHRLFPLIIGTGGQRIGEIREMFKQVVISLPSTDADQEDLVRLRGPEDEVDACAKYLEKVVDELREDHFRLSVPIYKQFHKFIVGKAGQTIKKIREETQTKIELPNENDISDAIVITGRKENVHQARDRIKKIQDEMASIVTEEISIPPVYYNSLIGHGGKLIQSISDDCGGVQIKFPASDSNSDKVLVIGPKDDVVKAVKQLEELKNEREASGHKAEVRAKQQYHRFLIGRGGATIKRIRDATGARIILPTDRDEDKELITIIGKKEQVNQAKTELEKIIEEVSNVSEDSILVPLRLHHHFVARRAALIQQISNDCGGVMISFQKPELQSEKVTLKGSLEGIERAKRRIEDTIKELEAMVRQHVEIPEKHHRAVMGTRGANVQDIVQRYNVQIVFPRRETANLNHSQDSNSAGSDSASPDPSQNGEVASDVGSPKERDRIAIEGLPENCEQAKKALLELVPTSIEIKDVPYDLHGSLIGKSGSVVRQLSDTYDVKITVSQNREDNTITVTGTRENCERARKGILERVEDLKKEEEERKLRQYTTTVEVDPEFHANIIGRNGKIISKIREEFDVIVSMPKRGDSNDRVITVQGYEEKAEAAKEHILKIVNELKARPREEMEIDARVHSRLIGQKGRGIRKIMDDYGVEVKFARPSDPNPNLIVVVGSTEDAVQEACDYIYDLAQDYLQDLESREFFSQSHPQSDSRNGETEANVGKGFVVKGAPWEQATPDTNSIRDFPSFGPPASASGEAPPIVTWGPRR